MNFRGKILLKIYQIITTLILPILFLIILYRRANGKEHRDRFLERFAIATIKRPLVCKVSCKLVWLHAVSVGESNSAWILIEDLLKFDSNIKILFTSTTVASAQIIEQKINSNQFFKNNIFHQFLPLDSYLIVRKFFKYWQPQFCLFVESEIWPNFIAEACNRNIKTFLINARISEKSALRWQQLQKLGFNIFDYFTIIFAQSHKDKNTLQKLCNKEVLCVGNLKTQVKNLEIDNKQLSALKKQIGNRKLWLCSSTHRGEEPLILEAHSALKKIFPDILTIIILRHPTRGDEVAGLLKNYNFCQKSKNPTISCDTEIYLVDSIGELGTFYSLTNFIFLGGSLLKIGGHNPIEALQLGCRVISGKYIHNNFEIYEDLLKNNTCQIVDDLDELLKATIKCLQNQQSVDFINQNIQSVIASSTKISQEIIEKIYSSLKLI